ncbi:putative nuclease HARBI1 [Chrysoperla carnea]|uniref:putative nuclease HARBI1 n=1 Tax=Chrysoperla carnea TaxID=189513 RepID=UPI001D06393D|nr:putative nuclease HARBI1 [Chrysoperla carnea]
MAYAEAAADLLDLEVHLYHMERRAERSILREIQDPFDLMDSEFKRLYRFTPDLVEELLIDTLGPRFEHQSITGISPKNQICHPDQCILNVNARFPGARHDAHIWSASAARRVMERAYNNGERRTYLLGDSGYPLEPWLLTPLPHAPAGTPRRACHDALMSSSNIIERTFGTLKTAWRCMHKHRTLQYDPGFAMMVK